MVVLAAIYAQEVMGFDTQSLIVLIMVVNVTAAVGAFICGHLQDRMGSVPTLAITLLIWIVAVLAALFASTARAYVDSRKYYWSGHGGKPVCRARFGQ